ncbi:MAG: HAMP domain-containing histidine kinase [Thermoleophilia bacterium]|nr:HAMP domain-containing histidine kinase [Thermoleophilia bacterium]
MFRSLRFKVPALFLLAIVLSGLVATAIAIGLFQDYARGRAVTELRQEAAGIAALYADQAGKAPISQTNLERATGDNLFFVPRTGLGTDALFPGEEEAIPVLPKDAIPARALRGEVVEFEFTPPASERTLLAVSHPIRIGTAWYGTLIVARSTTVLRERWVTLAERLALAFAAGVIVAGALGWYLSRRITKPVLGLSRAAEAVAQGRYDVQVPTVPGRNEISHLADRFGEMATRLRESEELERNFLMTVSHELRTPLTAIRGHVEALREGVVEDPELTTASLDVIAAETARLERLVGDVLDLAKLEAHRFTVVPEEVDMERLLDRAYAAFEQEARRRAIDYRRELRAPAVIESDGDRVLQIISNLLANAFRWTPDGGRIGLELAPHDGQVTVAVADTGPGIPPEEREAIFRPFVSGDGGGTGLGLAIAHELAHALGGRVEVESARGAGSTFRLVLPKKATDAASGRVR